mmetsp:Transcript_16493/g.35661  ORF Transcript_16493/g.35661 Transcript_16493/m.35661 type:complete len:314 (-) Transcript_16493:442-1383(-)
MDRTQDWLDAVSRCTQHLPQNVRNQIASASLLRPIKKHSEFATVAVAVAESISNLKEFIKTHQKNYLSLTAYSASEKDKIEAEVGLFVKTCTQQIDQLKESVLAAQRGHDAHQRPLLNGQTAAHLHGVVLLLAEKLHAVSARFDKCRAARYQQMVQEEELRKGRGRQPPPQQDKVSYSKSWGSLFSRDSNQPASQDSARPSPFIGAAKQQQELQQENQGIVDRLTTTGVQVLNVERTIREIATLNQLFSTAVLQQAEAIEAIYTAAVESSSHIAKGNEHLRATVDINRSTQKYIIVLLLVATFSLLFFDWFNS